MKHSLCSPVAAKLEEFRHISKRIKRCGECHHENGSGTPWSRINGTQNKMRRQNCVLYALVGFLWL